MSYEVVFDSKTKPNSENNAYSGSTGFPPEFNHDQVRNRSMPNKSETQSGYPSSSKVRCLFGSSKRFLLGHAG